MSEDDRLVCFFADIHHHQIEGVNVDCFKTNNDFFNALVHVSQHLYIGVSNIQLVLPLDQKTAIRVERIIFLYFEHKESQFLFILVC